MSSTIPIIPDHVVIRPIGSGAFGQVWLATNLVGTYRAIKVIERGPENDSQRLAREYQGIQRFEPVSRLHDGLVDVLQIGQAPDESYLYYVMELGDDVEPRQQFSADQYQPRTLTAEYRARTRIPAQEAALIGAQLAEALGFLHHEGLTHRDIKPSNILFVRGQPKICDPGLVAFIEGTRSFGGTLHYIPPEGPGTRQADIFSLGKLLYVIATGLGPEHFPKLPPEMADDPDSAYFRRLNLILLRACSDDLKERYSSAEEFRKDLLEVHAGGSPEESRRRLRIAIRVGIGLAVLLVLVGAALYLSWLQTQAERTRLAQSYWETALRLHRANDQIGALPFLAEALKMDDENATRNELIASKISFTWRYSPRLAAQWYLTNTVNRIAFNPASQELAVAAANGTVWLWDWRRGTTHLLGGRDGASKPAEAEAVAFSPNGRWLASAGLDQKLSLWDTSQRPSTNITVALPSPAYGVAFDPHRPLLAVGCADQVIVFSLDDYKVRSSLRSVAAIRAVSFHPLETKLLAGDTDGWVYEIDPEKGQLLRTNRHHWIYDLAHNRNGSQCAAASGNRARLDPIQDVSMSRLRHPTLVRSVAFDPRQPPGDDRLLSSCLDNTVRIWSCKNDEEMISPLHTETEPTCATYSADGLFMASSTVGGIVRVYRLLEDTVTTGTGASAVSGDGTRYALTKDETNVMVLNAKSDRIEATLSFRGPKMEALALSQRGDRLLTRQNTTTNLRRFELWDVRSRPILIAATNMARPVFFDLSPDGKSVAFRQESGLHLWQPSATPFVWPWNLSDPSKVDLRFSGDSAYLAAVYLTNVLVLPTAKPSDSTLLTFSRQVRTVDFNPTAEWVVVGESPPGFTKSSNFVWDVGSQRPVSPPFVLDDGCFLARFSPDGQWLLLADQAKKSDLFRSPDWKPRRHPMQHLGILIDASFSHNGQLIATQSGNRGGDMPTARVWDLSTGEAVTPVLPTGTQGKLFFLADDKALFCSTFDRVWHRWNLEKLAGTPEELTDLGLLLSCQRLAPTGDTVAVGGAELVELWQRLQRAHPEWFDSTP